MTGIDKILESIQTESKKEEANILSAAREKAEQILENARIEADRIMAETKTAAHKEADEERVRLQAQEDARAKQKILRTKRNLLETSFSAVEKAIETLPLPKYEAFLHRYLDKEIQGGEELVLSARDKKRLEQSGFLKKLTKKGLRLAREGGDFSAGFLLRKGSRVTNCSLESLLEEQKERLEPCLAAILFEGGAR